MSESVLEKAIHAACLESGASDCTYPECRCQDQYTNTPAIVRAAAEALLEPDERVVEAMTKAVWTVDKDQLEILLAAQKNAILGD